MPAVLSHHRAARSVVRGLAFLLLTLSPSAFAEPFRFDLSNVEVSPGDGSGAPPTAVVATSIEDFHGAKTVVLDIPEYSLVEVARTLTQSSAYRRTVEAFRARGRVPPSILIVADEFHSGVYGGPILARHGAQTADVDLDWMRATRPKLALPSECDTMESAVDFLRGALAGSATISENRWGWCIVGTSPYNRAPTFAVRSIPTEAFDSIEDCAGIDRLLEGGGIRVTWPFDLGYRSELGAKRGEAALPLQFESALGLDSDSAWPTDTLELAQLRVSMASFVFPMSSPAALQFRQHEPGGAFEVSLFVAFVPYSFPPVQGSSSHAE